MVLKFKFWSQNTGEMASKVHNLNCQLWKLFLIAEQEARQLMVQCGEQIWASVYVFVCNI